MTMYKEYAELYHTYTHKYGPKTAIFLMVGSFYELYDIQNNETGLATCNVREITDYLGIQLSVKKADISAHCDGLFAGFPDSAVHKWAGRLTSAGWTVVVVDQEKNASGKVKARKVARILSPSTHLEHMSSTDIPYIVTLYFHAQPGQPPACGAGALDLTTGTTRTYTGQATGRPDLWTADDVVQFISVFPPKEIWIGWYQSNTNSSATPEAMPSESHFRRLLGQPSIPLHLTSMDHHGAFSSELARSEYLQRCYGIKSLLPPFTYLGLRSPHEEMALLQLLHFVEEHHPSMLHSFHRNEPWIPHQRLICGNHALTQLQLAGPCLKETVMGLFDKCITSMGKRAIQERLMSPYSDAATIRMRLEEVTDYHTWSTTTVSVLERQLRFMFDLPRLHRKILCGTILPVEIAGLFQTYTAMNAVRTLTADTHLKAPLSEETWTTYHAVCHAHWDQEKAHMPSADVTPLNGETYPMISTTEQQIQDTWTAIHAMRRDIATAANLSEDVIRVEEREKEPFGFKGSTITLQQLKKNQNKLPDGITFSQLKSGGWIDGPLIQQWNTALQKQRDTLANLYRIHAVEACLAISEAGRDHWTAMEQWICHVDGTQCIGRVSHERGFSCPEVEDITQEGSAVDLQNLRHPLVEATASRAAYVTHHVKLGYSDTNGWLIYGMNASGKSTLMKATGLCILLAQAGCFVPATRMRLRPFRAIYTRILNQDNLFAGLSSFAVEMSELRDILRHADPYTLVLGDELCSGTESISAQALVASGIQWLAARHAKCMFATHLHGIPDLLSMKEHKMEVWHLHVEYDAVSGRLLYDRSLRPGKGSSLYGLEVARAMDLPFEFMEQAVQNRHRLMGTLSAQEAPTSSWNRQMVRKQCERCMTPIQSELEVHHVQERHTARHGILPNGMPMNDPRNLMVLCETCHDAVHANHVEIGPILHTSEGPVRIIHETAASLSALSALSAASSATLTPGAPPMKGKWSAEERQTIMDTLRTYSSMSFKSLRAMLDAKYDIQISESMLGKMRREAS